MSQIEERQQERYAGSEARLGGTREEPQSHLHGPGLSGSLTCRHDAPGEDDEAGPFVWVDDPPHEALDLEDDVADVEDGEKPVVVIVAEEAEVVVHAGDAGGSYLGPVEEGEEICDGFGVC